MWRWDSTALQFWGIPRNIFIRLSYMKCYMHLKKEDQPTWHLTIRSVRRVKSWPKKKKKEGESLPSLLSPPTPLRNPFFVSPFLIDRALLSLSLRCLQRGERCMPSFPISCPPRLPLFSSSERPITADLSLWSPPPWKWAGSLPLLAPSRKSSEIMAAGGPPSSELSPKVWLCPPLLLCFSARNLLSTNPSFPFSQMSMPSTRNVVQVTSIASIPYRISLGFEFLEFRVLFVPDFTLQ